VIHKIVYFIFPYLRNNSKNGIAWSTISMVARSSFSDIWVTSTTAFEPDSLEQRIVASSYFLLTGESSGFYWQEDTSDGCIVAEI
jgi:hypothetical protein